jgi:hypothetical protein
LPGQGVFSLDGQIVNEYENYKMRAKVLSGYARRVLRGLIGMCFRKSPDVDVPASLEPDLKNITLHGQTFEAFAKELLRENLTASFGGILVDWSARAQRPYQRLYTAESVLDWDHVDLDGQPTLSRIVLCEHLRERQADGTPVKVEQRREIVLTMERADLPENLYPLGIMVQQIYREETDSSSRPTGNWIPFGLPIIPDRREQPLGFIPFVPFTPDGPLFTVTEPVLLELMELIIQHYRVSADHADLLHHVGAGSLLFGSGFSEQEKDNVKAGGGHATLCSSTDADMKYVQTSGADAAVLATEMESIKHEMAVSVARLLLSEERRVAETAESQRVAFAADDATLQGIVGATAMSLEQALIWHTWWAGTEATPEDAQGIVVELNDDFIDANLPADDLNRLGLEVDGGRLSWSSYFWNARQGERVPPNRTEEEEAALIAADKAKQNAAQGNGAPPRGDRIPEVPPPDGEA